MQFVDKVCFDALRKSIENNVMEDYRDNIVYQWLRKPCMAYIQDKHRLTPEGLFYMSFWLLDLLKQYKRYDDCRLQNDIQCIPYDIEEIIDMRNYNGDRDKCFNDRMFVLLALSKLLHMLDSEDTDKLSDYLSDGIEEIVDVHFLSDDIFPTGRRARMTKSLTTDSPIFAQSSRIMRKEDFCEAKEDHLIDYIERYMVSDRRISAEIATLLHTRKDKSNEKENPYRDGMRSEKTNIASHKAEAGRLEARVKELEGLLEAKEREMAEVREEKGGSMIRIANRKKSSLELLLCGLYYADYFVNDKGVRLGRDETVQEILKHGFRCESGRISKDISQYLSTGTVTAFKDDLIKDFKKALDDVERVQR